MGKQRYTDGIREAESDGSISYHDCSPETFGPPDTFSFLQQKNLGKITAANARELRQYTNPFINGCIATWEQARPRKPMECLVCGPGAGREITELNTLLPRGSSIDTLSLTPLNPQYQLCQTADIIHSRMCGVLRNNSALPMLELVPQPSIDQVWKHRHAIRGILEKNSRKPVPRHQFIGQFPAAMRITPAEFPRYQMIIENCKGPVSYSEDPKILVELYKLLAADGAMFLPDCKMGLQIQELIGALRSGDIAYHDQFPGGAVLVVRRHSPFMKIFQQQTSTSLFSELNWVQDVVRWKLRATEYVA